MGLSCVISDPFKREHKRQRLSDLEKEAADLRHKLESQAVWGNGLPPTPTTSVMDPAITNMLPTPVISHASASTSPAALLTSMVSPPAEVHDIKPPPNPSGTLPRTIEGITIAPVVIDELFQIYFQHFHHFLPILDPNCTPNNFWDRSNLLFWSIITVSCRSYTKDPTLLDSLGDRVMNMCLLSLRTPLVPTIKAILLILTWPLSKRVGTQDSAYTISGSIIHMAMQIGLHIPTSSQDFSRVKVDLTEIQIRRRAELWGYCIVTYQRCCSFKGYSPLALMETYQDAEQRHVLFQRIGHSLKFQLRLNGVLTRSSSALLQNGLRVMSRDQQHALDIIIRVFEATLKDIEPDMMDDLDKFYLYASRLTLQAFTLYKQPDKKLPTFMQTRLYTSACTLLRHIDRLDSQNIIKLSTVPHYFFYATSLASFCILRLLKASTAQYMDENAKKTFFLGVNVMKRLSSSESDDGPSRMSQMLTQLWNSEKAFKNPDGTEHTALRLRTRLAMSPVFDAIWWWREEFGGQRGVYTKQQEGSNAQQETGKRTFKSPRTLLNPVVGALIPEDPAYKKESTDFSQLPNFGQPMQDDSNFLDDHLLAELGWTSGQFFYPPIPTTFNAEWYSPTDLNGFAI
jgi:hypothetical protein